MCILVLCCGCCCSSLSPKVQDLLRGDYASFSEDANVAVVDFCTNTLKYALPAGRV